MMILGLILSGIVGLLGFGYLVSIMLGDEPAPQGHDTYPPDSEWPVDWEQFPE